MESAFSHDGLANSHPIKVPVNYPDEINEIFDSITYKKVFLKTHKHTSLITNLLKYLICVEAIELQRIRSLLFLKFVIKTLHHRLAFMYEGYPTHF